LKRKVAILLLLVMIVSIAGMPSYAVEPRATFICGACGGGAYGKEVSRTPVDVYVSSCSKVSEGHMHRRVAVVTDYYCGDCGIYLRTTSAFNLTNICLGENT
jgi:hypothetical protein